MLVMEFKQNKIDMKKHELLEKAMRDYPAGTNFKWVTHEFTSTGVFKVDQNTVVCVGLDYVGKEYYSPKVYVFNNGWATIIPDTFECAECERETETSLRTEGRPNVCRKCSEPKPSILTGKCAIQVNNEREFKLLMEHYESRGWVSDPMNESQNYTHNDHYCCYDYHDHFRRSSESVQSELNYTIIPFADFAAEFRIKVPVFVMRSEDGVDLYEGDNYYRACDIGGKVIWHLITIGGSDPTSGKFTSAHRSFSLNERIFSTKEVAEKWIEKQNKANEADVPMDVPGNKAVINYETGSIHFYSEKNHRFVIHENEIKRVMEAYSNEHVTTKIGKSEC